MNKTIITFAFLVILSACKDAPKDTSSIESAAIETDALNAKEPKLDFGNDKSHDFGTITEGEKVEHTFKFTNTGELVADVLYLVLQKSLLHQEKTE
jgi:hypothetical protein